jgi:hypothetical protein
MLAEMALSGIRAEHTVMDSNAGAVVSGRLRPYMTTSSAVERPDTRTTMVGHAAPRGTTARATSREEASDAGAAMEYAAITPGLKPVALLVAGVVGIATATSAASAAANDPLRTR